MERFPLVALALRSIRQNPSRLVMMLLAVAASVGFVVSSFVVADSLTETFSGIASGSTEGVDLQVRAADESTSTIDASLANVLQKNDGIVGVSPFVEAEDNSILGLDAGGEQVEQAGPPVKSFSWDGEANSVLWLAEGSAPMGPGEVAISRDYAELLGRSLGDEVTFATASGLRVFTYVGIADTGGVAGAQFVLFDLATAQSVYGVTAFDGIDLAVGEGVDAAAVIAELNNTLPIGLEAVSREVLASDFQEPFDTVVGLLGNVLLGFAAIACVISVFVIYNTFAVVVGQRLREFGLLRSIGAGSDQIVRSVGIEALALGLVASIIGIGAGIAIAEGIQALFRAVGGFPETGTVLTSRTVIIGFAVGCGVTIAASLSPALSAGRTSPMSLMRPSDDAGSTAVSTRVRVLLGLGLSLAGGSTALDGTIHLLAAGSGGLLLCVAAVQSAVIAASMLGSAPIAERRVPALVAARSASANPKRTGATAAALMLGIAMITLVSVVGASLKTTFAATLDDSLAGSVIVTAATDEPLAQAGLALDAQYGPNTVEPGLVATADGGERAVLYVDGVGIEEAVSVTSAFAGVAVADRSEYIDSATAQIDQIILLANLLLGLTLIVALIGVTNTMALSVAERSDGMRLQRIVGMSRRQLRRSVRLEAVAICFVAAPLGLLLGAVLAGTTIASMSSDLVSGISFPVGTLAGLVLIASAGTVAAAAVPARRASKVRLLA